MDTKPRKTDSIRPYHRNPRRNDGAIKAVAESIRRYGFRQPIVVDREGVIIVGHTRWKAAKLLGLDEVPVHVADMTEQQAREYRIADNKTNELAEWDPPMLRLEMEDLDLGWLSQQADPEAWEDEAPGGVPACDARMSIPPRVWLESATAIRRAFDSLAAEYGCTITWPS